MISFLTSFFLNLSIAKLQLHLEVQRNLLEALEEQACGDSTPKILQESKC